MEDESGNGEAKKKRKRRPKADPALSGSNVYSVAEGVLLKWLTYHVAMVSGKTAKKEAGQNTGY